MKYDINQIVGWIVLYPIRLALVICASFFIALHPSVWKKFRELMEE